MAMIPSARPGFGRLPWPVWFGLAAAVVLGATAVPLPFTGDQAFYTLGGQALAEGKLLYRDFWDVKQPGMFVFFRAAGGLFGYHEVGVHLFELAWQLALALLVVRVMRDRVRNAIVLGLAPVLAVGTYYLVASPLQLTQLEPLVSLPVLGAIWLGIGAVRSPLPSRLRLRMVGAGLALFVVATFKLVLVAVPVGCLVVVWFLHRRSGGALPAKFVRTCLTPIGLAFTVPSVAFIAWAAARGLLPELFSTWVVFPMGVTERAGRDTAVLRESLATFAQLTAPLLVFAAIGARHALPRHRDPVAQGAVAWLVLGSITYLVQLWWLYQLFFFIVPLGLLATYGVDTLWSNRSRAAALAGAAIVLLLFVPGGGAEHFARRGVHLAENRFAIGREQEASFRAAQWPRYAMIEQDHAVLHAAPADEGVVVWGDPLYVYLAHSKYALGVTGWAAEQIDDRLWHRAAHELAEAKPEVIFVDAGSARYLRRRGPEFATLMARDYRERGTTTEGTWYQRKPGPTSNAPWHRDT